MPSSTSKNVTPAKTPASKSGDNVAAVETPPTTKTTKKTKPTRVTAPPATDQTNATALPPEATLLLDNARLEYIAGIVYRKTDPTSLTKLTKFFEVLGISDLSDLHGVSASTLIDEARTFMAEANLKIAPIHMARIIKFCDYASREDATFPPTLSLNDINAILAQRQVDASVVSLAAATKSETDGYRRNLKITAFAGDAELFWEWADTVKTQFGKNNLEDALTDPDFQVRDPKASRAGFFALKEALQAGSAAYIPRDVENDTGNNYAYDLYHRLVKVYDTAENQAHFMHYAVGRLIGIEMGHYHSVEHFISEWKDILQRLEYQGEVSWKTLLWVFLLRACNSHAFTDVRDYMIKNPCLEQDDYIRELRSKASMQKMLNDESPVGSDGQAVIRRAGKAPHHSKSVSWNPKGNQYHNIRDEEKTKSTHWRIPPIPDGFDTCIHKNVFRALLSWRKHANGSSTSIEKLNHNHAIRKRLNTSYKKDRRTQGKKDVDDNDGEPPSKKQRKDFRIESAFAQIRRLSNGESVKKRICITEMNDSDVDNV